MLTVEVDNVDKVIFDFMSKKERADIFIDKAIETVAFMIERDAAKNCADMGAVDTGRLMNSINVLERRKLYAKVGTLVHYASYVHWGLGSNRKYGARPFLSKAADKGRVELWKMIKFLKL